MFQEELLHRIKKQIGDSSLNEVVAQVLDIGYDAAHRRTSGKSKLSFEEGILLAKHFNLSLDSLFSVSSKQLLTVERTATITKEKELEAYYLSSYESLVPMLHKKDCSVLYSAKDIPIFYTSENALLNKFKTYVWLKILDSDFRDVSFEDYSPKPSLIKAGKKLSSLYNNVNKTEVWDVTTVNSVLKQIHFYFKAEQLTSNSALEVLDGLQHLIATIQDKLKQNDGTFLLYYNEILLMNNTVMVKTPKVKSLYVPFTVLTYFLTKDIVTCNEAEAYFSKELKSSKLLNTAGEKEQNVFFNKMFNKINTLKMLIKATVDFEFE
ncbi:hypothetical protein [Wenyingzhuangia sp. IMCC45574]